MTFDSLHVIPLSLIIGYLVGSIPFGLIISFSAGKGDIRKIGSGNIGATNVLRTGSKTLAALTLILDAGKGAFITFFIITLWGHEIGVICGLGAVLGHNFSIWLRFKGGKGIATTFGVLLVVSWPIGLLSSLCWIFIAIAFRYSSLASLISLSFTPFFSWWLGNNIITMLSIALAVLSIIRHSQNIKNLFNGTETKIKLK